MTKDEILETLKLLRPSMAGRFSVKKIGLFGSYARNAPRPDSDIDLLVELGTPTFDNYMDLKFLLEDKLGKPVVLVLEDCVKPRLAKYINEEVLWVP